MREEQGGQNKPNQSDPNADRQGSQDREPQQPGKQADRQTGGPQKAGEGKIGGDAQRAREDLNPKQGTAGQEGNVGQQGTGGNK